MSYSSAWKTGTAALVILGLTGGTVAPFMVQAPAQAQSTFPDVPSSYWAEKFIQPLAARGIIAGFPDGTFRPEEPVTRAQFAAMINRAFNKPFVRNPFDFTDVPRTYWAYDAIQKAYRMGFMAGFPGGEFQPDQNIFRMQIPVALASGLQYLNVTSPEEVLKFYTDQAAIPGWARQGIATATTKRMIVNYPDVRTLNPNRLATRAEVAAFLYQALVSDGQVPVIDSPYIVGGAISSVKIPAGTQIPLRYEGTQIAIGSEPIPVTLRVAQNIVDAQGRVLIPVGSSVAGQIQPVQGGARFIARELTFPIQPTPPAIPMSAASDPFNTTIRSGGNATTNILIGTGVGAGAGAGIAAVTGDRQIQAWEPLVGAAAGAILGAFSPRNSTQTLVLNQNTDLIVTLDADLVVPVIEPR